MRAWFSNSQVRVAANYWISEPEGPAERDVVIINEQTACTLEVKATVPTMKIRRLGNASDLATLHKKAAEQAFTAATALAEGRAFEDKTMRSPIPPVKRVIPCAITFDFLAVRWPYSDLFESVLQDITKMRLFSNADGVCPFQILDIQQVEMWDDLFSLPAQTNRLFRALERRALDPLNRYRDLAEDALNPLRPDYTERPGIIRKLAEKAEETGRKRLMELQ